MRISSLLRPAAPFRAGRAILVLVLVVFAGLLQAVEHDAGTYDAFAELLSTYVIEHPTTEGGLVSAFDYGKALTNPETARLLRQQTDVLKSFNPASLKSREQAIAFWINAYNFFMLAHVLENPVAPATVVEGVKDFGSLINPFAVFGRELFDIGGTLYSLDQIEKEILLGKEYQQKGWKDARVHFAVNCASVGCPPLRQKLYEVGTLDAMLTENVRRALKTPVHLQLENKTLHLTSLFDWYRHDFEEADGSVIQFILNYSDPHTHASLKAGAGNIRYIDYNWALNTPANVLR